MPAEEKVRQVEELKERFAKSTIVVATAFSGLGGASMTDFRQHLRGNSVEYRVVRNTLASIAAEQAGVPEVKSLLQGATGLALGYGDPVETAKVVDTYVRNARSALAIRGAGLSRKVLTPEELTRLTTLPPKLVLVAQLLGQMQSPIVNLVSTLNAPITNLVFTLNQVLAGLVRVLQGRVAQLEGAKS